MAGEDKYLFSEGSSHAVVANTVRQTGDEVKRLTDDQVLNATDEALIDDAIARCTFKVPEIAEEEIYTEEREVEWVASGYGHDPFYDRRGSDRVVKQHIIEFHVPFRGNAEYFKIAPSSRTLPGPLARVVRQELIFAVATASKDADQIKREFEGWLVSVKQHLTTLERDLVQAPPQIETFARSYIPTRRAEILRNKNLAASLGYPMKRRPDAPTTFKATEVRRKLAQVRPATQPPFKPEPVLDEQEYQHILSVMDNMTKVMERSPHTFARMEEEDIRQHFLVQLNGHYEGQATGETFNAEGKTDILIRSDGRNIFMAECKIWRGEKSLVEAIDQLLGYLTWRDTKTALVIFNKNKNLSAVIQKIGEVMDAHEQKKRGPKVQGPTRLQYVFANPGDPNREITITVMVYDIPEPAAPA